MQKAYAVKHMPFLKCENMKIFYDQELVVPFFFKEKFYLFFNQIRR